MGTTSRPIPKPAIDDAGVMGESGVWVFGYGSLMWRPGFEHVERAEALLRGYRRRLCVVSRHHRGTDDRPGLVMGLDRGGSCRGAAYRVAPEAVAETLAYLHERETAHYPVYRRATVTIDLVGHPSRVPAIAYTVDRRLPDYAGDLTIRQQAAIVSDARGISGHNADCVRSTVRHIQEMGLRDPALEALLAELEADSDDRMAGDPAGMAAS